MSHLDRVKKYRNIKANPSLSVLHIFEALREFSKEHEEFKKFIKEAINEKTQKIIDRIQDLEKTYKDLIENTIPQIEKQEGPAGLDGYTPIKNVDYFDGKDGYTPIKSVDYFDGKDGESPSIIEIIKNIVIPKSKNGSSDTPEQIIEKLNISDKEIEQSKIAGLVDELKKIKADITLALNRTQGVIKRGRGIAAWIIATPVGTINSVNRVFTIPTTRARLLFLNGVQQTEGTDFTRVLTEITYTDAPLIGDIHELCYLE